MPISEGEWASIYALVERATGNPAQFFTTGKVVRRDAAKKLVWLAEFGPQAIPVVGFDYEVRYYDTNELGVVNAKLAKITVIVPKVGETVLVARELGAQRLPRCLGKIQGTGWITPGD